MLSEPQEFNKNKIWNIISRNVNQNQLSTKNDPRIKTINTINKKNKSHPTIHRKIIPLFIDEEIKVYQRDKIMHKFDIFENERKKKYTNTKMNNLFEHLFYNKNNKKKKEKYDNDKINILNSPTTKNNLFIYHNFKNNNKNDLLHINLSGSNKNYFQYNKKLFNKTSNISKEETEDNFDSIETSEKAIKVLEDKYFFFNKNKNIDKRRIQINRIFKNPKYMKIKYFHEIDKIKRAHFMDLTPDSIFLSNNSKPKNLKVKSISSNYNCINKKNTNLFNSNIKLNYTTSNNNIKNENLYKTMSRLDINKSSNKNLNYGNLMNSTTGFKFIKNNNDDVFKTKNNPEFNLYVKTIINGIN